MLTMTAVKSSNVAAVGYDPDTSEMRVAFKSGATYDYAAVGQDLYQKAIEAESVGKFISSAIVGKFKSQKVPLDGAFSADLQNGHDLRE